MKESFSSNLPLELETSRVEWAQVYASGRPSVARTPASCSTFHGKICLCASSGGHYNQLSQFQGIVRRHPTFVLTERTDFPPATFGGRSYLLPVCSRTHWTYPLKLVYIAYRTWRIFREERPDAVIATGAMATLPILMVGKAMGKKIIFVEALARVESASLTGKIVYRFADLFIVRWPEMLKVYPRAVLDDAA